MPTLATSSSTSNVLSSGCLDLPSFSVQHLWRHENLHERYGPWGGGFGDRYQKSLDSANDARKPHTEDDFPSRLFDAEDNMSFQAGSSRPEYTVMSYTWGRWEESAPETPPEDDRVEGCHWKVPYNEKFTRSEFKAAVRKIAKKGYIWVDVFCIPQEDKDPEKAREIGKQGAIFRGASRAAIWLGTGGEEAFREVTSWYPDYYTMIEPNIWEVPEISQLDLNNMPEEKIRVRHERIRLISEFNEHVPWTNSLWTLQEAALRPDAVFYNKAGDPILHKMSNNPITVQHLMKTMVFIRQALSRLFWDFHGKNQYQGILDRPDVLAMNEEEISRVFKAIDVVNVVSLDRILATNAGELLFTSGGRESTKPNDRIYGIMGAIGANVKVNYDQNFSEAMDLFLIELHNKFPIEMQAFHRPGFRSEKRQWLMDADSIRLTLLRQKRPPPLPIYQEITPDGQLGFNAILYLSRRGINELHSKILSMSVLPALDRFNFCQLTNGLVRSKASSDTETQYSHFSLIIRHIAFKYKLALVPLGEIAGMDQDGWKCAYILVVSRGKDNVTSYGMNDTFQRLGLLLMMEEMSAEELSEGRFSIL